MPALPPQLSGKFSWRQPIPVRLRRDSFTSLQLTDDDVKPPYRRFPKLHTEAALAVASNAGCAMARLRKHADYQRVYRATRKQFSASMTWFLSAREPVAAGQCAVILTGMAEPDSPSGPRVGLTVGKVLGKAHERNRIKRRLREVVRCHIQELPDGVDLILHPQAICDDHGFWETEDEVLRIFRQAAAQVGKTGASQRSREIS